MTTATRNLVWKAIALNALRWLLILAGVLGVTLLLMAFAGVFHVKVAQSHTPRTRPIPLNVVLFEVAMVTQPRFESAIGTIKPVHEADVASKILARVLELNVTAGKAVSAGDVLVRLSANLSQFELVDHSDLFVVDRRIRGAMGHTARRRPANRGATS